MAAAAEPPASHFSQWADIQDAGSDSETVEDEIERYKKHKATTIPNDTDILDFWRSNEKMFPTLARLARKILCVPASSVSCESAFSTAGRTLENRRTCLSTTSVNSILFLNSNM